MIDIERLQRRIANKPAAPRRADVRRASILDAAAALFVRHGVDETTVDDIAKAAGLGKGTFYHYFPGKADLLPALRDRFCDDFLARVVNNVDQCPAGDWEARLETWLITAADAYFDMYPVHDVVFHGADMPLREAMGDIPIILNLAALLSAGEADGFWRIGDAQSVALLMFGGMHAAVDEAIVHGRTAKEVGPTVATLFLRMIRK